MRLKICKLDGLDVRGSGLGIDYTKTNWTTLSTTNDSTSINRAHRSIQTPLEAKKRTITLEGVIDHLGNPYVQQGLLWLQQLFSLQENLYTTIPRQLYIKDIFDNEWLLDVIVADAFEFSEYTTDFDYAIKWRIVLESCDSPAYRSLAEYTATGGNGVYGYFDVNSDVPFDMQDTGGAITISQNGNAPSPIKWTFNVTANFTGPLRVYNVNTGEYMRFTINGTAGDVIIIDGRTKTATKNGTSILNTRQAGSTRLTAKGIKDYVVLLEGQPLTQTQYVTVTATFYNMFL